MTQFCPLYSGSSSSSAYLSDGETGLLIDAGSSCKAILSALEKVQAPLDQMRGIVLTHEHDDHIKGLRVLLKKLPVPVYASQPVLEFIEENICLPAGTQLIPLEKEGGYIGGIFVRSFPTPHDSVQSSGYRFSLPDGREIGIATDLGTYTDPVHNGLSGCDLVMLESNYEDRMLEVSSYPYFLKRRIRGEEGHLSNRCCAQAAVRLAQTGTQKFVLCHLSEQNNTRQLAYQNVCEELVSLGLREKEEFTVQVAKRKECSERIVL